MKLNEVQNENIPVLNGEVKENLNASLSEGDKSVVENTTDEELSFDEQLNELYSDDVLIDASQKLFASSPNFQSSKNEKFKKNIYDEDDNSAVIQWLAFMSGQRQIFSNLNTEVDYYRQPVDQTSLDLLKDISLNGSGDPTVDLDKEKLSITINFPSLDDLKRVNVQYDPNTRSIVAELLTSQAAAQILQSQVSTLERNLAKHDIKLNSIKIIPTEAGSQRQGNQEQQRKERRKEYS